MLTPVYWHREDCPGCGLPADKVTICAHRCGYVYTRRWWVEIVALVLMCYVVATALAWMTDPQTTLLDVLAMQWHWLRHLLARVA